MTKKKQLLVFLGLILLVIIYFSTEIINNYSNYRDNNQEEDIYVADPIVNDQNTYTPQEEYKEEFVEEIEEESFGNISRIEIENNIFPIIRIADNDYERLEVLPEFIGPYGEKRANLIIYERNIINPLIIFLEKVDYDFDFIWINSNREIVDIEKGVDDDSFPKIFKPKSAAKYLMIVDAGTVDKFSIEIGQNAKLHKLDEHIYKLIENFPEEQYNVGKNFIYYSEPEDAIYFEAGTSFSSFVNIHNLIKKHNPSKIITNSTGGSTYTGILIGKLIQDFNLDVEVKDQCFSSCANYIFTSGKNKYIRKNSLVAWHGTPSSSEKIIQRINKQTELEQLNSYFDYHTKEDVRVTNYKKTLTNTELKEYEDDLDFLRDLFISSSRLSNEIDRDFYRNLKINNNLPSYSLYVIGKPNEDSYFPQLEQLKKEFGEDVIKTKGIDGITFSIEDMEAFGIKNVYYKGSGKYPEVRDTPELKFIWLMRK